MDLMGWLGWAAGIRGMVSSSALPIPPALSLIYRFLHCEVLQVDLQMRERVSALASPFPLQFVGVMGGACWATDAGHVWNLMLLTARRFLPLSLDQTSATASNRKDISMSCVQFGSHISKVVTPLANYNHPHQISCVQKKRFPVRRFARCDFFFDFMCDVGALHHVCMPLLCGTTDTR